MLQLLRDRAVFVPGVVKRIASRGLFFSQYTTNMPIMSSNLMAFSTRILRNKIPLNVILFSNQFHSNLNSISNANSNSIVMKRYIHNDMSNMDPPVCPECNGNHTYYDGISSFICPDCSFEWNNCNI